MLSFNAVAIDTDAPDKSTFLPVIDREMISQSVLHTHHATIFPTKSTRVIKMAARIEAVAFFSNWKEWNKMLDNFTSSYQVEVSVFCSKCVAAANRRLSPKVVPGGGPRVVVSPGFGSRSRRFERNKNVSSPSTCESQYCGEPP